MQRTIVQVMTVRMGDVLPNDIVNKNAEAATGWFECTGLQDLPNGGIVVLAESDRNSINGEIFDMVGVQLTKVVDVPDASTASSTQAA